MKLYFYIFYKYFINKKWVNPKNALSRAILLVGLTLFSVFNILFIPIDHSFELNFYKFFQGKLWSIPIMGLFILYPYLTLVKNKQYKQIINSFDKENVYTEKNILLCWGIFIASFIIPMILAVILKGISFSQIPLHK